MFETDQKDLLVLSPLASSMFTPGIKQIADSLHTDKTAVVGATTSFVVFLGIGPLVLAPLSEVFGRRKLYLVSFSVFSLVQIPTALSPNVATLIALRTVSGFCGSRSAGKPGTFRVTDGVFRRGHCKWRRHHQRYVSSERASVSGSLYSNLKITHSSRVPFLLLDLTKRASQGVSLAGICSDPSWVPPWDPFSAAWLLRTWVGGGSSGFSPSSAPSTPCLDSSSSRRPMPPSSSKPANLTSRKRTRTTRPDTVYLMKTLAPFA